MKKHRNISIGVGVLIIRDGKLLVTERNKGSSWGAGSIAMPGGHIEEFETLYDCAVREIMEETGLIIQLKEFDYTYVLHAEEWFRQGRHHWTIYVVAAPPILGEPVNTEPHKHKPWQWVSLDVLQRICTPNDWIPLPAIIANRYKIGL